MDDGSIFSAMVLFEIVRTNSCIIVLPALLSTSPTRCSTSSNTESSP